MMLDVDFVPCTDFRSFIKHNLKEHLLGLMVEETHRLMEQFVQGTLAFVIPAFEYARQEEGIDPDVFPRDKTVSYRMSFFSPPQITLI